MPQNVLKLNREVDECKPLGGGRNYLRIIAATWPQLATKVGRCRLTLSNPR